MKHIYLEKKEALEKELEAIEAKKAPIKAKIELLDELIAEDAAIPHLKDNDSALKAVAPETPHNPFRTL